MTTSTKVLLGIIGAAAAGAVIGMLLAPEKGMIQIAIKYYARLYEERI